mgnify:CR=1 FL=1
MYSKETLFKITDDIAISEINNESVILNLKSGVYFQVNELGTFIISQLKEYSSFELLNDKITKDFNVIIGGHSLIMASTTLKPESIE